MLKSIALSAGLAVLATQTVAGGLNEPIMPAEIVETTMVETGSGAAAYLPIIIMAMMVALAQS